MLINFLDHNESGGKCCSHDPGQSFNAHDPGGAGKCCSHDSGSAG